METKARQTDINRHDLEVLLIMLIIMMVKSEAEELLALIQLPLHVERMCASELVRHLRRMGHTVIEQALVPEANL